MDGKARFNTGHHRLGLRRAAMNQKPAGAFRHETAQEHHQPRQYTADDKSQAPAIGGRHQRRIQHHQGSQRAQCRADPVAAIDQKIDAAAKTRRGEFLDGGIDRGIFAADARAGERAEKCEGCEVPGKAGGDGGDQIDAHRDQEQSRPSL